MKYGKYWGGTQFRGLKPVRIAQDNVPNNPRTYPLAGLRLLLGQRPCVDCEEVVCYHGEHGESAKAVGEVVQLVVADHSVLRSP